MTEKTHKPPAHLGRKAKAWFTKVAGEFVFQSEAEWRLLEEAAGCIDRLEQSRKAIEDHGLLIATGTGSQKPNPAVNIERDCRTLLARLIRELRLGDQADEESSRFPRISPKQKRA